MPRTGGLFKRFVQIGRVVLFNYGPNFGKLAVVVNILDQNRILVDGPAVARHVTNLRRVSLTDFTVPLPVDARRKTVLKAVAKAGVVEKFQATAWAKKLAKRQAKDNLTDFDRFKVLLAKKRRANVLAAELHKVKVAVKAKAAKK